MPLVAYYKENALAQENNLFSDYDLPSAKSTDEAEEIDVKYLPHLKPTVSLYILFDTNKYSLRLENANMYLKNYINFE